MIISGKDRPLPTRNAKTRGFYSERRLTTWSVHNIKSEIIKSIIFVFPWEPTDECRKYIIIFRSFIVMSIGFFLASLQ